MATRQPGWPGLLRRHRTALCPGEESHARASEAAPAGTPTGLTYGTIENLVLQAETGSNIVTVTNLAPATAVTINDNGGNDTLVGPNFINTWALTGPNQGTLTALLSANPNVYGRVSFSGVENLTGGSSNDVFQFSTLSAGSGVSSRIDGGGGTNSLDYSYYTGLGYGGTGANVTLADAPAVGTATGTGGASNIQNVQGSRGNDHLFGNSANNTLVTNGGVDVIGGGNGTDRIFIDGQQLAGTSIDGGNGTDTLKANDGANTWNLTAPNQGDVSDAYGDSAYDSVENLTGGLNSDMFRFMTASGGISGLLNGNYGTDWLDDTQYPGAVTVNLETGSATGVAGGAANRVAYMENVIGARGFANTLTGASTPLAGNPAINALGNALSNVLVGGTLGDTITGGSGRGILIGEAPSTVGTILPGLMPCRLVLRQRVEVLQRLQFGVHVTKLVGRDDPRRHRVEQERRPGAALGQQPLRHRRDLDAVDRRQRVTVAAGVGHADGEVPEQVDQPPDERRPQERHVARGQVRRLGPPPQRGQPGGQPLERSAARLRVAHDLDARWQWRHVLPRPGDHHDRRHDFAQDADDPRQHQLAAEGQPGFRPAHAARLPTTQNDAGGADHAGALHVRSGGMPGARPSRPQCQ